MNDYTTHKYVVAAKRPNQTFRMFFACDDLSRAKQTFDGLTSGYDQVRVYTREQWNGKRETCRYHKNLVERTDPIPQSIGMWVVNQARSDSL